MIQGILKEATGLFDRHALKSAFFPSVIAVFLLIVAGAALSGGIDALVKHWDGLSGTRQFGYVLSFFVVASLLSILTSELHPLFARMFEGDWGDWNAIPLLGRPLAIWRMRVWQRRADARKRRRDALHQKFNQSVGVYDQVNRYLHALPAYQQIAGAQQPDEDTVFAAIQNGNRELRGFVRQTYGWFAASWLAISDRFVNPLRDDRVSREITRLRRTLCRIHFQRIPPSELAGAWESVKGYVETLRAAVISVDEVRTALDDFVRRLSEEVDRRKVLYKNELDLAARNLLLNFPFTESEAAEGGTPVTVACTRLGNVMLGAENYPRMRYGIDSKVVWPRLQPSLPDKILNPILDTRSTLNLLLTVIVYTLTFGLPVAVLGALESTGYYPLWVVLLLVAFALLVNHALAFSLAIIAGGLILESIGVAWSWHCAALPVGAAYLRAVVARANDGTWVVRRWASSLLAPIVLLAVVAGAVYGLIAYFDVLNDPRFRASSTRYTIPAISFLIYLDIVLLVVSALYICAVQVAVRLSERIQPAYDLHRSSVLEPLHFPKPEKLSEEKKSTWPQVCQFLYRSALPESKKKAVAAAKRDIAPGHMLTNDDVQRQRQAVAKLPDDVVVDPDTCVGKVAWEWISEGASIRAVALVPADKVRGKAIVCVDTARLMFVSSTIRPGDVIDITSSPAPQRDMLDVISRSLRETPPEVFEEVPILDQRAVEPPGEDSPPGRTCLVLAIPRADLQRFAAALQPDRQITIARRIAR